MRPETTTAVVLAARGASHLSTITRDLRLGLFARCEPKRVSTGFAKKVGVFYRWPRRAVERAAWIRQLKQCGLRLDDIQLLVMRGRGP